METVKKLVRKNGKAYLVTETELYMSESGNVQWAVHFFGGGWNSVWARTHKEALALAKKEYSGSTHTRVEKVTIMTPSLEQGLLRQFY